MFLASDYDLMADNLSSALDAIEDLNSVLDPLSWELYMLTFNAPYTRDVRRKLIKAELNWIKKEQKIK